jgi:hypothetical protein
MPKTGVVVALAMLPCAAGFPDETRPRDSAPATEEMPPVSAGDKVRCVAPAIAKKLDVRDPWARRVEGTLVRIDDRNLTIEVRGSRKDVVVPRDAVERIEKQAAPSHYGKSMLKGAGAGLLFGATLGALAGSDRGTGCGQMICLTRGEMAILAGAEGVVVGSIIGLLKGGPRWERASWPGAPSARLTLGPVRGGIALAVHVEVGRPAQR